MSLWIRLSSIVVPVVAALAAGGTPQQTQAAREILGRWRGTSLCVKADWNRACNDEVIVYDFVPDSSDASRIMQHAYKVVNGKLDLMGDLSYAYTPTSQTWDADFSNSRVSIRWSYQIHGDSLVGWVTDRPTSRVGRHVVARRDRKP
ncbi:MAG: hypothetical protein U0163_14150 [Gemmatimonadaceae bacterium]